MRSLIHVDTQNKPFKREFEQEEEKEVIYLSKVQEGKEETISQENRKKKINNIH
jgi:hypothetical protein